MSEFTPPGGEPQRPERPPDPWQNPYASYGGPGPYDDTAAAFARARTSKKMAGWGLGLSLVWCLHPFTLLVSAGLSIAALVRSGDGREHGRGMAIAALVINGLWVVLAVVLVVTGVVNEFTQDAERDEDGRVTERSDISAFQLRVGDCLNDPTFTDLQEDETAVAFELEAVPCDDPHDLEVYHRFELPEGDYPGEEEIFRTADEACYGRTLRSFTGKLEPGSTLEISYYYPQSLTWRLQGDREVICVIGDGTGKTSGTLRDVGR